MGVFAYVARRYNSAAGSTSLLSSVASLAIIITIMIIIIIIIITSISKHVWPIQIVLKALHFSIYVPSDNKLQKRKKNYEINK